MPDRDPFLAELWHRKADEEKGVDRDTKATDLYLRLQKDSEQNETLKVCFENLTKAIGSYADAVIRLSKNKKNLSDSSSIENADRGRKIMHDALIDAANQMSRAYKAAGIDNSWRSDIMGIQHRGQIGRWALAVARFLMSKDLSVEDIDGANE